MILDDKKRIIGKIVAINSDRFTVELLSGTKNFSINGYDDIHYFGQINSYVMVPYQDYYIVSEVIAVREKDAPDFVNQKEQELNKIRSVKQLDVLPVGTLKDQVFSFGVSVYPTLYSDVLYTKDEELDALFNTQKAEVSVYDLSNGGTGNEHPTPYSKTRLTAIEIGDSAIFPDYTIKANIDNFFGSHSAVLGNTGSGKSCTIASMLQTIFNKENECRAVGATFLIFDVNGEYKQAFEKLHADIAISNFSLEGELGATEFKLPHYFLNIDEWELLLQASEKTQRPILRTALGLASLFGKKDSPVAVVAAQNHILATCINSILSDESSSPSKSDRIKAILRKFKTSNIALTVEVDGPSGSRITIDDTLNTHYAELKKATYLVEFANNFILDGFEMPVYRSGESFNFDDLEKALDLAIFYEESHGNKHIRDYCSSLITRVKNLKERPEFSFLKDGNTQTKESYLQEFFGVKDEKKIAQIVILNIDSIEDELVELIAAVFTRMIFETLRQLNPRNSFPVNLILEEAHRYISERPQQYAINAGRVFERVAKEGRKYGLFLLISSQRPSELSRTVLSQCNNFIVHRIQNPEDLSHIRQITPHISEATLKKLPSIPTQHALIFGNAVNIPTLYKVKEAYPRPYSDNNKVSENWFVEKEKVFSIFPVGKKTNHSESEISTMVDESRIPEKSVVSG